MKEDLLVLIYERLAWLREERLNGSITLVLIYFEFLLLLKLTIFCSFFIVFLGILKLDTNGLTTILKDRN